MTTSLTLLERLESRQDEAAWRELTDIYVPLLRGWLRLLHVPTQDSDDMAQEILTAVVHELPRFRHNERTGAFRAWLRAITVNRVREGWHRRDKNPIQGLSDRTLDALEDPHSDLSLRWDREHDAHVVKQLLELVRKECRPSLWNAFSRQVLDGETAERAAAELHTTTNAVLIAKSRVLGLLRQRARGLLGES